MNDFLKQTQDNLEAFRDEMEKEPEDLGGFCLEVRKEKTFDPHWWQVAIAKAEEVGRMPALAYPGVHQWVAMVYAKDVIKELAGTDYAVTMPLDAFFKVTARRQRF